MTYARFVDYLKLDRDKDVTCRAYDLRDGDSPRRLDKALWLIGFLSVSTLEAELRNRRVEFPQGELPALVSEWYVWQRITDGVQRRCKPNKRTTL